MRWAKDAPERTFLAERRRDGGWREVGYDDDPASATNFFGQIAEIFIDGTMVSNTTTTQMQTYLHA